ncbi:DUF6236 family protein [Lentzea sp.]|uniref:DUF6236 family protein n=1 Tax=Lentzea sp. TaxID=56099 RepID=UPI002ED4F0F5
MSTHNEISGSVQGDAWQIGTLNQHVEQPRSSPSSIAFYYPYIHIRDDTWLKYAAMYWPKITRLVPAGYDTTDSAAARDFARAGVLTTLPPGLAMSGSRERFFHLVASSADELRARFGITRREGWLLRAGGGTSAGPGADPRLTYLHFSKLPWHETGPIVESGLGEVHHGPDGRWLGMHPRLAAAYMCLLAGDLARAESLHPITDEDLPHRALLERDADRVVELLLGVPSRAPSQDPTQSFVTAAVDTVVPAGLADVPAEKILELRETFPKDFHRFRAHVGDRFTELKADATADLHIGVAVDELVRAELAELEDKIRSVRLVPRRVQVWLKADAVRESPAGWLFRTGQALR